MDLDPEILKLLMATPWLLVIALIVWPEKGVLALWIKRGQAIKLSELKRNTTHKAVKQTAEKRLKKQETLPPPVGQLPAPKGQDDDNTG